MRMVYVFQSGETSHVKIGFTNCVPSRKKTLQAANPLPLRVVMAIPGDRKVETLLLRAFAARRMQGEWFDANQEMLDFFRMCQIAQGLESPIPSVDKSDAAEVVRVRGVDEFSECVDCDSLLITEDAVKCDGCFERVCEECKFDFDYGTETFPDIYDYCLECYLEEYPRCGICGLNVGDDCECEEPRPFCNDCEEYGCEGMCDDLADLEDEVDAGPGNKHGEET